MSIKPRITKLAWAPAWVVVVTTLIAQAAWSCPVCMDPRDEGGRAAFIGTTVLLSLLPLAMIGGFVWWVRRRQRELEDAERAAGNL